MVGGIVRNERGLLLVENLRRNGDLDWSPPGGVVDPGETPVDALTREVREETGLEVDSWTGPLYRVEVEAPDDGFHLFVEVYSATGVSGSLVIDDPDGIVVSADFFSASEAEQRLGLSQPWVTEPVMGLLRDGTDDGRTYRYYVTRDSDGSRLVENRD